MLLLSMILAAGIVMAGEKANTARKAKWAEARAWAVRKSAEREKRKRQRSADWERRFNAALSEGPRNPMWWGHALGWVLGGGVAAVTAAAFGAVSGAIAGGWSGYRLGIQIGHAGGREFGEAFGAWRAANRGRGDPVELALCGRCRRWVVQADLVAEAQHGQVCPECVLAMADGGAQPGGSGGEAPSGQYTQDGKVPRSCRNGCGCDAAPGSALCVPCRAARDAATDHPQEPHGPIWVYTDIPAPPELDTAADNAADDVVDAEVVDVDEDDTANPGQMPPVIPLANKEKQNAMATIEGGIEGATGKLDGYIEWFQKAQNSLVATKAAFETARWNGVPTERLEKARKNLGAVIDDLEAASTSIKTGGYSTRDVLEAHSQVGSDESVRAQ